MAKRKKSSPKLRRSCGAMAAHMALLEQYPAFRANQMRLEGATSDRRDRGIDLKKAKIVTIKTVVNVVYNTDEQNISQSQIVSQFTAMNKDFRATNPDKSGTPAPWLGLVTDSRIQFKLVKVTRTKTTQTGFTHDDKMKKPSTGGIAPFQPNTHLNLWVCRAHRRSARIRAIPRRAIADRRRRHQLPVLRHDRHGAGSFQERPHRDARDRTLLQPAAHLGGHSRLQRLGHGGRHAELRGPEYGHAVLAARHLQQRTERRHVHELHGLHGRQRHVHVHVAASGAYAHRARNDAHRADVGGSFRLA